MNAPRLSRLRRSANSIAIGSLGGLLLYLLGLPAPWISGAMIAVAAAALSGVEVGLDRRLRDVTFVVVGYSMGAGVSPETIDKILLWPISLVVLFVCVAATTLLLREVFRRGFGWDDATASFASVPGAFSFMMAVAAQSRARVERVAVAQISRLVVLVALLPSLVSLISGESTGGREAQGFAMEDAALWELLWSFAASALAGLAAIKLKLPAGALIGSLSASLVLHATGAAEVNMPYGVLIVGFIITGAFVGSRVRGLTVRQILGDLRAGFLTVAIGLVLSLIFAWIGALLLDLPLPLLLLAYAPGGLEVMVILSLALGFDPAFVGVHHVVRFLILSLLIPIVLRRYLQKPD